MKISLIVPLLVLSILAGACAGRSNPFGRGLDVASLSQTPGLPAPGRLDSLRRSSDLVETLIGGKFSLARSSGAQEQGTSLLLDASLGGPGGGASAEWALYSFDTTGSSPDSLQALLNVGLGSSAYIGLADFAAGRWEWHGPYDNYKTLLVDEARYVSPAGSLYCAVISPAGFSSTVTALSLRTIQPDNQAPSADLQVDLSSGNAPLTVNFDAGSSSDPEGQPMTYLWDWEGDGLFDASSISAQVSHVYSVGGSFQATLRVEDSAGAGDGTSVSLDINSPPHAVLSVAGAELRKGQQVHLSAQQSTDSDGSISSYEWDVDGDGIFEQSSGTNPEFTFDPALAGPRSVGLRVTDDDGAQSSTSKPLWVRGYNDSEPEPGVFVGDRSAIALVGGRLAVCYRSALENEVRYSHSLDERCTSWSAPVVVKADDGGTYFNLLEIDGRPAIAWQTFGQGQNLAYCHAQDAEGSAWNSVQILDGNGLTGFDADMDLIGGVPAIVWFDKSNNKMKYVRANDPAGDVWGGPVTVELTSGAAFCSLDEINGRPALAWCNSNTYDLMFERADDAEGSAWSNFSISLDTADITGLYCSLAELAGGPAIAYYDADTDDLRLVRSLDGTGNAWNVSEVLDDAAGSGHSLKLEVIDGHPTIGYLRATANSKQLLTIQALDSFGMGWGAPDSALAGLDLQNLKMTNYQGHPAFSVYNNGHLSSAAGF